MHEALRDSCVSMVRCWFWYAVSVVQNSSLRNSRNWEYGLIIVNPEVREADRIMTSAYPGRSAINRVSPAGPGKSFRYCSSHLRLSISRWTLGSSNNNMSDGKTTILPVLCAYSTPSEKSPAGASPVRLVETKTGQDSLGVPPGIV